MFTKIALAAALIAGTASVAMAQGFDPNLANRYPADADPGVYGYTAKGNVPVPLHLAPHSPLQSAPVRLHEGRNSAPAAVQNDYGNYGGQESEIDVDINDRASSPYAGGGF